MHEGFGSAGVVDCGPQESLMGRRIRFVRIGGVNP